MTEDLYLKSKSKEKGQMFDFKFFNRETKQQKMVIRIHVIPAGLKIVLVDCLSHLLLLIV